MNRTSTSLSNTKKSDALRVIDLREVGATASMNERVALRVSGWERNTSFRTWRTSSLLEASHVRVTGRMLTARRKTNAA